MNFCNFSGKTILVTGASSGIGAMTANLLSRLGAKVILVARNEKLLNEVQSGLAGNGHLVAAFDLNQLSEMNHWLERIVQKVGLIDGLVHSAGIHLARPLRLVNEENMNKIFNVNVTAGILLTRAFCQKQVKSAAAAVVFLSSVVGAVGQAGVLPYATSKGAIIAATKSLAVELASEGVRVNAVLPGMVKSAMSEKLFTMMGESQQELIKKAHPLGLGEPEDVANAITFLLSDAAKWITGSCLTVDGGYTAL